jgi:hypothetical protein
MKPTVSLRKALNDPQLLGHVISGPTWSTWRTLLIAAMGEPLTDDERVTFTAITGRTHEPGQRVHQLEVIVGRRGGKTRALATLASYISGLCDHRDVLAPGEDGICLALATDQRISKKLLDYVEEDFNTSPLLRQLIVGRNAEGIQLTGNIRVEARPADFRKLRGPTYIAVLADELAFWYVEDHNANPDAEVLAAARPGLLTTNGPMILASSPYSRRGVLWDVYKRHFGPNGAPLILVAKGTTRDFNPSVPQAEIERLLEEDRARNSAEYLAEFRSDLAAFINIEVVESCVASGVIERPPMRNLSYCGFLDPSGGSSDSMTLAIGHLDNSRETVVIDALRESRPPFSPEGVTAEFCKLLASYNIGSICSDRYAGSWVTEQFGRFGIIVEPNARPKSDLYVDLLPLLNSRRLDLLDHAKSIVQLCGLERRTSRGGKDSIDHGPGGHDDLANVIADVAAALIIVGTYNLDAISGWGNADDPFGAEHWRALRLSTYLFSGGTIRL